MSNEGSNSRESSADENPNFGGLLDGMANLIGRLSELAEKGEQLKRNGTVEGMGDKPVSGSYGFSVKFGPGGQRSDEFKVAPVARPQSERSTPPAKPQPETREPHVDVFGESDHLLVVAEMPGVSVEDVQLDFSDASMMLTGKSARVHFAKQIELGRSFSPENIEISVNNGVVEIKLNLPEDAEPTDS